MDILIQTKIIVFSLYPKLTPLPEYQFSRYGPKNLLQRNLAAILGLEEEKHIIASNKNGVVGKRGKKTPIAPRVTHKKPAILRKKFLNTYVATPYIALFFSVAPKRKG